jgi:hypothetical protein
MRYSVIVASKEHQGLYVAHTGVLENVAQHIYEVCCNTVEACGGTATVTLKAGLAVRDQRNIKEGCHGSEEEGRQA